MNKSVLALSTALSIFAFTPAFAQDTAPAPAAQVDCSVAANANDPACMNKQNNATTGQSDSTTATQPSTTTGQSDSMQPSTTTTGQSDSTTTTTTTGQSDTNATTDTTGSTAPVDNSATTTTTTSATGGSLIVPADQLAGNAVITASDFIGKRVYDTNGENIGEVNDMILTAEGDTRAIILGVGGFLGIGEKNVAVSVDSVKMVQDGDSQRLVVEATKEMLESAPSYDATNRRYTENNGTTTAPATGTGTTTTTEQPATQQ